VNLLVEYLAIAHTVDQACTQNMHTFVVQPAVGAIRVVTNSMQILGQRKQD
jgi:hypothetical protein